MEDKNSCKTKVVMVISYCCVNVPYGFAAAGSKFMMDNIIWYIQKTKLP